jgi:hypothetical protein
LLDFDGRLLLRGRGVGLAVAGLARVGSFDAVGGLVLCLG